MRRDLTPTEERILDYLAEGLYDAEIAVRLGLPVQDLKQRITRILQREHLLDRAHLLEWWLSGQESPQAATLQANESGGSKRVLLIFAAVAIVFIAMPVAAILLPGDSSVPPSDGRVSGTPDRGDIRTQIIERSATMAARLEQTATAGGAYWVITPSAGGSSETWEVSDGGPQSGSFTTIEGTLGDAGALLVSRENDTGTASIIERIYRDPSDREVVVSETIWEAPEGTHLIRGVTDWYGGRIALAVTSGEAKPDVPHSQMIVGSTNGQFSEPVNLPPSYLPHLITEDRVIIAPTTTAVANGWLSYNPATGAIEPLQPPEGARGGPIGIHPVDGLVWLGEGSRLLDRLGDTVAFLVDKGVYPVSIDSAVFPQDIEEDIAVAITWTGTDSVQRTSVFFAPGWFHLANYTGPFTVRGSVHTGILSGSYCTGPTCRPALLRVDNAQLTLAAEVEAYGSPPDNALGPRFPYLFGSQRGPFVRVKADASECTFANAPTDSNQGIAYCARPGELLPLRSSNGNVLIRHLNDVELIGIRLPTGDDAWIEASSLDPILD